MTIEEYLVELGKVASQFRWTFGWNAHIRCSCSVIGSSQPAMFCPITAVVYCLTAKVWSLAAPMSAGLFIGMNERDAWTIVHASDRNADYPLWSAKLRRKLLKAVRLVESVTPGEFEL